MDRELEKYIQIVDDFFEEEIQADQKEKVLRVIDAIDHIIDYYRKRDDLINLVDNLWTKAMILSIVERYDESLEVILEGFKLFCDILYICNERNQPKLSLWLWFYMCLSDLEDVLTQVDPETFHVNFLTFVKQLKSNLKDKMFPPEVRLKIWRELFPTKYTN